MGHPLIDSLTRAVEAAPGDVPLRLHLAELLVDDGQPEAAVSHCAVALQHEPTNAAARTLMTRALAGPAALPSASAPTAPPAASAPVAEFDWQLAESDLGTHSPQPMFVDGSTARDADVEAWDVERSVVTLADVGGMAEVKDRLTAAFLAPMRNPELRRLYGKSLRGGMLLYGPPGCGKTFIGAGGRRRDGRPLHQRRLADVLDMCIGSSERNLADLFRLARDKAPVVLFLDEIDALGQKRSQTRNSAMRGAVNQLLTELDGVRSPTTRASSSSARPTSRGTSTPRCAAPAASTAPCSSRRPTSRRARRSSASTWRTARSRASTSPAWPRRTDGFSGADVAHVCETASEKALMDGVRTGTARMIGMGDLDAALAEVRPSTGPWFEAARNVVQFANEDGTYDELREWMRKHRRR